MSLRLRTKQTLLVLLSCVWCGRAQAHEPAKALALAWSDASAQTPSLIVTNRGLVFVDPASAGAASEAGRHTFSLRCAEAYGASTSDHPSVAQAADASLLIGTYQGVVLSADRSCSFTPSVGLPSDSLGNVVRSGSDYLTTTRTLEGLARVLASSDGGATWSARYQNESGEYFERLLPVPSDARRLYAAGARFTASARSALCGTSEDAGEHWTLQVLPDGMVPFAVHPTRAEVVFAYQNVDVLATRFRVLRSQDACQSFETVLSDVPQPAALSGAPGSATLWLGFDGEGGLQRSDDDGASFARAFDDEIAAVSCLEERAGRIWMCATSAGSEHGVWTLAEDGTSFSRFMALSEVSKPVTCDDADARALCAGPWYDFYSELHPPLTPGADAGAPDGGAPADAGSPPADGSAPGGPDAGRGDAKSRGGCQVGPAQAPAFCVPSWLALIAALGLRRRAREPARGAG